MSNVQSVFYSATENSNFADTYSLDPSLMSQLQNNPILSPMYGQFDQDKGFDSLLNMEFSTGFGMVESYHDKQIFQEQRVSLPMGSAQAGREEELGHNAYISMPCLKKLSHNANERHRRKKLNGLYAQLQALLPNLNPKRRLSIPNTVCEILKYIPELRNELQTLRRRRDTLLSGKKTSKSSASSQKSKALKEHSHSHLESGSICSAPAVTLNCTALKHSEVLITVHACKFVFKLSRVLVVVEEEGLELLNASKFISQDRLSLILQLNTTGRGTSPMEALQKKIVLSCEKRLSIKGQEKFYLTNCQQSYKE